MILDLNDLRIFVTVASTASITRAAEQLNYVQSNISARIKLMEEHLDVTLFNRMSRGGVPTASGKLPLEYAVRILALSNEAERIILDSTKLMTNSIANSILTTDEMQTIANMSPETCDIPTTVLCHPTQLLSCK